MASELENLSMCLKLSKVISQTSKNRQSAQNNSWTMSKVAWKLIVTKNSISSVYYDTAKNALENSLVLALKKMFEKNYEIWARETLHVFKTF